MPDRQLDKMQMQAYLLAQLPAEDAAQFEDRYFSDDRVFLLLEEARYDLLDGYAAGMLSPEQSRLVERHLLKRAEPETLSVARGLTAHQIRPRRRMAAPIAAAIAVASLATSAMLYLQNRELRSMAVPQSRPQLQLNVASISLTATLSRAAADPPLVRIPAAATIVTVELALAEPDPIVDVTVEAAGKGKLLRIEGLRRQPEGAVNVYLRAADLPDGDYEFLVSRSGGGSVLLGTFPCRILRR